MAEQKASLSLAEATAQMTRPGAVFEMEAAEVNGISMRVWKNAPPTLRDILNSSRRHAERDFLVYEDERITFAEHFAMAATFAQRLEAIGVRRGDRVAIAMRNLPEWVVAFWGAICLGALVVPLNAWWTAEELIYGLVDSGSSVAVVDAERLARLRPHLDQLDGLAHVIVASENRGSTVDLGPPHHRVQLSSFETFQGDVEPTAELPEVSIEPDDDATIFYTSGTTGHPKGAVGSHRNAVTNMMNLFFFTTRSKVRFGGNDDDASAPTQNSHLLNIPLFHATGCHAVLVVNTAAGGKIVITHHFDPERTLELLERERITTFGGVPTLVMQVLDSPDFAKRDLSSVRSVSYGGAPAPAELVKRIKAAFPVGEPGNGYGMTETSAASTLNTGPDYVAHPDSVGPIVPVADAAVVPEGTGALEPPEDRPRGADVTGELWIRGPQVVRGYWNKPEATAQTFTNGWVHTGDIARIDDEGFIYIVDRSKDVIIRGGENIYSVEVEATLFEHPAVADCAVIGVPHPTLGEEVGAVIVLRTAMSVSAEELARHVAQHLAAYNVPKHFFFREDPLPRNAAGKILKRQLRDEVLED
jgi:long-chain acyl-CoA synthetase